VIVAATNHEQMLDAAIFRRFDETITFSVPSKTELVALLHRTLADVDVDALDTSAIYAAVTNPKLGYGDVCAALDRVRKDNVIAGEPIDTKAIVGAVSRRARTIFVEAAS
jgi:AAA+ superfamily predicted ATPase